MSLVVCAQGNARTYIYVLGMQRVKPFDSLQLFYKMTTYSEEVLRKLKKDDLIGIALSLTMSKFWRN